MTFAGKSATFGLYVFLPLAFIFYGRSDTWHAIAIAGIIVSAAVYWYAGFGYVADVARRSRREAPLT